MTQISRQLYGLTDIASLAIPLDLETAFSLDLVDVGNALMQLYSYDRGTGTYNYFAAAGLVATHLTVSRYDVAAVPLPAALPMLLSGFAGLCILARRRKRDNIAA